MRVRLRDLPDRDVLYPTPHDHTHWGDHIVRVNVTVDVATPWAPARGLIVDLSCGNGTIARELARRGLGSVLLGDYAPGWPITGPIEETIFELGDRQADLFVCSETIEHLDDPDAVLKLIRAKAHRLVLSTPDGETDPTRNPEHVWGWDAEAVDAMLAAAGWAPLVKVSLDLRPAGFEYCYMIRVCQ
jgi:hypothetical protein